MLNRFRELFEPEPEAPAVDEEERFRVATCVVLLEVAGADKFNTGEIEKSIVNMYGHLQGHIQRGVNDLENLTNSLLRQKTDVRDMPWTPASRACPQWKDIQTQIRSPR